MSDERYDIAATQGATFSRLLTLTTNGVTPIDLTGCLFEMQARKTHSSPTALFTIGNDTGQSGITVDPLLGKVSLLLTDEQTQALPAIEAVYDLFMTTVAGVRTRLLYGSFHVSASATRS